MLFNYGECKLPKWLKNPILNVSHLWAYKYLAFQHENKEIAQQLSKFRVMDEYVCDYGLDKLINGLGFGSS